MSGFSRRAVVGAVAPLLLGGRALARPAGDDGRLRAVLDALPRTDPARALAMLSDFDPGKLSLSARLDRTTVRAGLAIDRDLADRFAGCTTGRASDPDHYLLLLKRRFGSNVTLAGVRHRIAAEMALQTGRATQLFRQIGIDGGVGASYRSLFADARYRYSDDEAGRDRAVADMTGSLTVLRAHARHDFAFAPAWCFDVAVRRTSRVDEAAGKSGRRELPSPDRPGAYYIDLTDIARRPTWTLPAVVAHELLPGHMIQLPIEAAADPHPLRLQYASGFAEGWAIHMEHAVAVRGRDAEDPRVELGRLHWLIFRLGRALIDLAIHLDGLSLEGAEAALGEWQGEPAYFAPFAKDLAYISNQPAGRCAEALCWLAIDSAVTNSAAARQKTYRHLLAGGRKRLEMAW